MSCFPNPTEYAALLAAGQQQVLSQLMRSQAPTSEGSQVRISGGGSTVGGGGGGHSCSQASSTPLPPTQDLVPLQPLLQEYLASAFRIPPLPNLPQPGPFRQRGPGPGGGPAPAPAPAPPPPFFCTLPGMSPLLPGMPPEVYPRGGVLPMRPFPAPGLYFPPGPRPVVPPVNLMVPGMHLGGAVPCTNAPPPPPFPYPYVSFPGLLSQHETLGQQPSGLYKGGPGCVSQGGDTPQRQQHQKPRHHGSGRRKRRAERRAGHVEELGGDNVGVDGSADGVGDHNYPMKRSRLVWTPELHQRFLEAVNRLGNDAVPKNIMQVMNVEGLTRSNVASHLQKYRLQMKRCEEHCTDANDGADPEIQEWRTGKRRMGKLMGEDDQNIGYQFEKEGRERTKDRKRENVNTGPGGLVREANVSADRSQLAKNSSCSLYSRSEGSTQPSAGNSDALPNSKDKGNRQYSTTENSPVTNYGYSIGIDMQAALLEWGAQMGLKVNDRDWEKNIVSRLMNSHLSSEIPSETQGIMSRSRSHPPTGSGVHGIQATASRQSLDQNGIPGSPGSQPAERLADKESRTMPVVENEC